MHKRRAVITGFVSIISIFVSVAVPSAANAADPTTILNCPAGSYSPITDGTPGDCVAASPGYFVPSSGATTQTPCPIGSYAVGEASTECALADVGYYVDTPASTEQLPCSPDESTLERGSISTANCILTRTALPTSSFFNQGNFPSTTNFYVTLPAQGTNLVMSIFGPLGGSPHYRYFTFRNSYPGIYYNFSRYRFDLLAPHPFSEQMEGSGVYRNFIRGIWDYQIGDFSGAPLQFDDGRYLISVTYTNQFGDQVGDSNFVYLGSTPPCSLGKIAKPAIGEAPTTHPGYEYYQCESVPAGSYASGGLAVECPEGKFSATGASECTSAEVGHYVPIAGSSKQIPCPLGSYSRTTGASACDLVDPGYFVAGIGQENQAVCPDGSYQSQVGYRGTSCIAAPAGSYVSSADRTRATKCALGTYQSATGATSCETAPVNTYVSTVGASTVTPCPVDAVSPRGSESATACAYPFVIAKKACAVKAGKQITGACAAGVAGYQSVAGVTVSASLPVKVQAVCAVVSGKIIAKKKGSCSVLIKVQTAHQVINKSANISIT